MRIGIDFDNTIVRYDDVFYAAARELDLIPAEVVPTKAGVRNHLRAIDREDDWTRLQGYIYGARMELAEPFPGVLDFFRRCVAEGVDVCIVSHKTRTPYLGEAYDLHAAARGWLEAQGFFDPGAIGLAPERVFFELTKDAKLARIGAETRTVFVDDLPEFLAEPAFPARTARILFDPNGAHDGDDLPFERAATWTALAGRLLGAPVHAG
ncbi:hypothetical protein [Azospirillum halopraeferens]|uniref:hypothetical protein n=1 Tax=Azospirillum halopraeferens TaxID=34010 RepID=UPI00040A47F0|nr:hypothetical protein [Azospirillum halopraeferens]